MFTEINATEYLDDLWDRDGPYMHLYIKKFGEVCTYSQEFNCPSYCCVITAYCLFVYVNVHSF